MRALRAIDDADIALLVIDATEGVTGQDQRLAERVDAAGCPILVVLNKWELITDPDDRVAMLGELSRKLAFVGDAPVLKISALTGKGVHKLRPVLQDAITQYHRRVPTRDVNRVLAEAQQRQPAGGGAKVLYAVQGASDPPTFTLVRQPRAAGDVRALPRALDPRGVRVRLDAAQAARPPPDAGDAVPWCERLREVLGAVGDDARRHAARRAARSSTSRPAPTAGATSEDEKAPWHFKLLVVALVVYLGWRFFEMFFA